MGTQPGAARKLDDVRRPNFPNRYGEARCRHPRAVRRRKALEEVCRPDGADDLDRRAPRREISVLPREDQRREVAVVVDMKMREGDVRDARPIEAELGETPRDAAAAVDKQPKLWRFEQVARAASARRERDRSGAKRREAHAHGA